MSDHYNCPHLQGLRMPRVCLIAVITLFFISAGTPLSADTTFKDQNREKVEQLRDDLRQMITSARDKVFPSLVNIRVTTSRYLNGEEQKGQSVGSGTIISPEGYVLTNFHVARNGRKFVCTLSDKQEINAELVGEDPLTDLAVLKLNLDELKSPGTPLAFAVFGDSDSMVIGDTVMSMGSPWALSRSVTLGIVSNTDRLLASSNDDAGEMRFNRDQRTGIFTHWIQHDSSISPGNSGGPLVNLEGEVIGINAMGTMMGGSMGFAIPSNLAKVVAAALIEHGQVPRSRYGWKLKPIKKSGYTKGVLVNSVVEDGPAAKAGIEAGDIIVRIDDNPVTIWFPEDEPLLLMRLASYPIGSQIKIVRQHNGELLESTLVTTRLEAERGREASFRKWGFVVVEITQTMAHNRRLPDTSGILVQSVRSGSPAQTAVPALNRDDVITAINAQPVNSISDLLSIYDKLDDDDSDKTEVMFEFSRRGRNQLTLLDMQKKAASNPPREVAKSWIGVAVQPVLPDLAKHLGTPDGVGFRITRVYPGTLAAQVDLEAGDIILALNGNPIRPRSGQDFGMFHRQVRGLDIGQSASLSILRDNVEKDVSVILERTRMTAAEVKRENNEDFGLTVRGLTFFDRDENRWSADIRGILIEKTERAGWAQLGNLRPRDLILMINEQAIENLGQFRDVMESVTQSKQERVTFLVLRGVETRFQYIEPDWVPQVSRPSADVNKTTSSELNKD
jgi:serine protease Do